MTAMPKTLRYSADTEPGYSSEMRGETRVYSEPDGRQVEDEALISRFNALGIPPAYKDVWICKDDNGHLQMTGRDAAGRKQYRYHDDWRAFRDAQKFEALTDFAAALPRLRRRIARDLRREDIDRRFVTAALLRMIDTAALRIGNLNYTQANGSFGATTLRSKHIKLRDNEVRLDFRAKGGKRVRKVIKDKTLNRVLESIDDLPGRGLFQYVGRGGDIYTLDSAQVNAYLGDGFTAKTFRTWHGTSAAFRAAERQTGRLTIKEMSEAAAARLHNTPAICRSSYIHPAVTGLADLDEQTRFSLHNNLRETTDRIARLRAPEARCLNLLSQYAA